MKNLLKKWVAGGTTWEEEKNLRRAATKDDFLSEAMEGYDAFPNSNHSASVERLKGRLPNAQSNQDKGGLFTLPRIAAAAAMVGVVSTLFWVQNQIEQPTALGDQIEKVATPKPLQNVQPKITEIQSTDNQLITKEETITNKPKKEQLAKNNSPKPKVNIPAKPTEIIQPAKTDIADLENTSDAAGAEMADLQMEESTIAAAPAPAPIESADIVPLSDNQPVEQVVESEPSAAATSSRRQAVPPNPAATSSFYANEEQQTVQSKKRESKAKNERQKSSEKINFYTGQVQNEDGQPLHDVKIVGTNTSFKTATQYSGDFMLQTTVPISEITVSKDGFHTRKVLINQYSDFLNISLLKKSTKIADDGTDLETIAPKPQKGFMHFLDYLKANQAYPAVAGKAGIEREVEIRFMIDENGTPTDLKVVNPDQYGFDKEAVRLLQNGPKWEPTNSHARYFVSFELE